MNIVVTGGCGFIGSYVVDKLIMKGYNTHVIDINNIWINKRAINHTVDVCNKDEIDKLFQIIKPSFCIHLAGILGTTETWDYPDETVKINIIGANNIYDICGKNGCNIITVDVGSRWLSPYTISKSCSAEFALAYANKYKVKVGLLRIFNVYGPRQSNKIIKICPRFILNSLDDKILEIWGNKMLDLIYVEDVADAFVKAVEKIDKIDKRRDIYIGSGKQVSTLDFAQEIINRINKGKIEVLKPRLGEEDIDSGFMNNFYAKELLDWEPTVSLEEGLNNSIEFYKTMQQ